MFIQQYKTAFTEQLNPIYDPIEIESLFFITLQAICNYKRIDLALQPDLQLTLHQKNQWDSIVKGLLVQKPLQYLLGETYFFSLPFYVNNKTLIPRPETEELVNWILETVNLQNNNQKINILDIGTGSGCIAIALAKNIPKAEIYALDVCNEALKMAQKNADRNQVAINFIKQDILETVNFTTTFDIIVSNPPYVRDLEKVEIQKNVLDYEPHLALFVPDQNPLLFYEAITKLATQYLTKNGQLFFEINQYLAPEMLALVTQYGFKDTIIKTDIYGNNRMLKTNK